MYLMINKFYNSQICSNFFIMFTYDLKLSAETIIGLQFHTNLRIVVLKKKVLALKKYLSVIKLKMTQETRTTTVIS